MPASDDLGKIKELQHIAIDPLDQVFTWPTFQYLLAQRAAKMKVLLMDQKFISGLGNIYSDEVLFAAGLRYDRVSDTLSSQEVRRLYRAIQETLQEAIKARGTTLDDDAYLDLFGKPGAYQDELKVYGRCRLAVSPVPDPDPDGEDPTANELLLSAVPELTGGRPSDGPTGRGRVDRTGVRRVHVVVRGRVQGVFFRTTCAAEARARAVAGWVRNLPDGTVEAVFEGASSTGRSHARVVPVGALRSSRGVRGNDGRGTPRGGRLPPAALIDEPVRGTAGSLPGRGSHAC